MARRKSFRTCLGVMYRRLRQDLLLILIVIGVIIGFLIGATTNGPINRIVEPEKRATVIMLVGFPGELFMNALKMLILPLIVASLITALATLDAKATGKIGRRTIIYYLGTMLIAVIIGIVLVTSIKPGELTKKPAEAVEREELKPSRNLDSFLDLLRSVPLKEFAILMGIIVIT